MTRSTTPGTRPIGTVVAAAFAVVAALTSSLSSSALGQNAQIGPYVLYPSDKFPDPSDKLRVAYPDVPLVMRDAIHYVTSGSRLLDLESRIMGGELAPIAAYPWVVSIELKGANPRDGHFCSGAFIGAEWVLTAAHCVKADSAGAIQVHSGAELDSGGTIYDVDSVIVNERYDDTTKDNDVALIHLAKRFSGEPVRLAGSDEAKRLLDPGTLATALGWGLTAEGGQVSNLLRRVTVQIDNNKTCNGIASYPGLITDTMVCAGFPEGSKDSCQGDGGGPLIARDSGNRVFQIGILSWGEGCRRPLKFGVYTRVASIKAWVDEKIGKSPQVAKAGPLAPPRTPSETPLPPPRPAPGRSPTVAARTRSVVRMVEVAPTPSLQLGPRRLYPRAAGQPAENDAPLPIRDAQQFLATGRRLLAVQPRIVGGEPAPAGAYPWAASLELKSARSRNAHFCGAAFISPEWVLTAAHCVKPESAGSIDVLGGSHELDRGGKLYQVDRVVVHERYDAGTQDYDVALVHLASRYDGPTIRPITAAEATQLAAPGTQAVVAGWGLTAEGTDVSDVLRRVNVVIQSPAACNAEAAYGGTVNGELMLCAGFAAGGKDACQGDSGGPLMVMDRAGGYLQAGIVSWGEGCAKPNRYGVYTRVSAVEPWIAEHTGVRQAPVAGAASRRAAPVETRMRSIEENAAPPPRSGVRSNSRVELPGNPRAQVKTPKPRKAAQRRHKPQPLRHRAAESRAEAVAHVERRDPRFLSPGAIP